MGSSIAELEHDVRARDRRIGELEKLLRAEKTRAESAEAQLTAVTADRNRVATERDAAREQLAALRDLERLNEEVEADPRQQDLRSDVAQAIAELIGASVAELLRAVPLEVAGVRLGRVLGLTATIRTEVFSYKQIPEVDPGARRDTVRAVEAMRRAGQVPLVLVIRGPGYEAVMAYGWKREVPAAAPEAPPGAAEMGREREGLSACMTAGALQGVRHG